MENQNKVYCLIGYHDKDKPSEIFHGTQQELDSIRGWSSKCYTRETLEELKEKNAISDEPCSCCGSPYSTSYVKEVKEKLLHLKLCHTCNFWKELIEIKDQKNICRIDGRHMMIGPKTNDPSNWKGCGGAKFTIEKDGKLIETDNLWHQGEIPTRFLSELPDNAKWKR